MRLTPIRYAIFVLVLLAPPARGQLGSWQAHTSMREGTGVTLMAGEVWVSTSGGVFRVDRETGIAGALTAVDGLHAVGVAAISQDAGRSAVWVGYGDGVLDRISTETGTVRSFRDIARAGQFTRKAINRIVITGDSLLVCTDFGLVVFDPVRGEVRDAFSRFGELAAAIPVSDVAVGPSPSGERAFWVATDQGLAFAPASAPNLQDPAAWTVERPPTPEVRAVAFFEERLHAATSTDVYVRASDGSYAAQGIESGGFRRLTSDAGHAIGVTEFNVLVIYPGGAVSKFPVDGFPNPRDVALVDGTLWVADGVGGLLEVGLPPAGTFTSQPPVSQFVPTGPSNGSFVNLHSAADGSLWAGGVVGPGSGFHRLSTEGVWTDYTAANFDVLAQTGGFPHVSTSANGEAWAGSEGSGAARVDSDGLVTLFDESNSSLRAVTGFPGFIIVGGVAGDADGGVWTATRGAPSPLHYRSPSGTWTGLPPMIGEGLSAGSTAYADIYIDSFGQKWIIVREESSFALVKGLAVLDTGADPTNPADDSFRFFGTRGGGGQGLPSRTVTSIVEDRDGLVWVGTGEGLAFFPNTGVIARDPGAIAIWPQRADRSEGTFLYLGLPINDLAVDPANRLWIATNDGVRVVASEEGGFEEVLRITADNSPLLSNVVVAIEVIPDRGEVFFATDEGLVSAEIDAITAAADAGDLFVYPNPVRASDAESVTIEGLVDATLMNIVSPLGELIRQTRTRGGRATWDLRDQAGHLVPSGVYIVVAVGENGEGAAYGKVAVIN